MVQWLRIHLAMACDTGLIPVRETKIPRAKDQLGPRAAATYPALAGTFAPQLEKPHGRAWSYNKDPAR